MKLKCSFILKSSVALLLAMLMLFGSFSTVFAATVDVAGSGANITSDGNALLFFKMNAVSWWNSGTNGNQNFAYFYGTSGSAWSAHSIQQTGNYYYVKIPSGTWDHVILTRNSVTSSPSWDNKYNQTGDIALESGKNYISAFSENSATATFSTYQVDSTASLSASKTSVSTGESVTLTPGISTNTTYNDYKSVSYSISPSSGASISGNTFTATAAGTYTVTATVTYNAKGFTGITKTATATSTITVTSATEALPTPSITLSSSSVTASPTGSVTLTVSNHNDIAAKDSGVTYELYKNGTKVTQSASTYTYANGVFTIPARYSNNASTTGYSVKAIAANTTNYSDSATSTAQKLTISKTKLTAPTVAVSKTDIAKGDSITLTVTDKNTSVSSDQFKYRYSTTSSVTTSSTVITAGTPKSLSPTTDTTYRVAAVPVNGISNEYYTQSDVATATQVKVYSPSYKIAGSEDLIGSSAWSYSAGKEFKDYTSSGIFTFTTESVSQGTYYFKLYNSSNKGYTNSSSSNTAITLGESNKYTFAVQNDTYSFSLTGSGVFVIYYDTVNQKIWVTQNTWNVKTSAYTQKYNVSTGSYDTASESTTGGTVSPASDNVEKGSATTLTATANPGYTFVGWYKATTFITANQLSTSTSFSYTPSASGTVYALFKQNEPAKVTINVDNVANATITAKWNDQTKTNGQSLTDVPVGASVTVTVTPATGYYLTGTTPTLDNSGKFTVSTSTTNITATVAKNATITPITNKSSRGTVSVDKTSAHQGETITITITPLAGSLKSLTASYANGAVYTYANSTWTQTTAPNETASTGSLSDLFVNPFKRMNEIAATGASLDEATVAAMPDLVPVGATQTINMEMQYTSNVTINAVFDPYSGESTWYYNGYDTSGNALSGYHTKQMTESMVSGEKFSYYHVEGRTGTDQLMTVTDGSSATYGYVYFTCPGSWTNLHVYFFDGVSWNWPGDTMTAYGTSGNYRYQIPSGAKKVIFNNGDNSYQTVDIDLTSTCGAYYVSSGETTTSAAVGEWSTVPTDAGISTGKEYFYQNSTYNGDYTGDFNTKGFYNHYTAGKEFAKPKDLGTNTGDYYINVLYPNTTYTINGVTKKTGTNPMIIWSAEPLASDDENVTVYAKDGAIRAETFGSTYANIADTKIYAADGTSTVGTKHNGSITNQTYETYKAAKGDTLVIKTQIGATDSSDTGVTGYSNLRSKYYVRGFCVNGEVSELLEWNANGLYTLTYKIPEDTEITKFEITPIYYLKDTTANPIVTYRVTGFTDELKQVGTGKPGWGDTLYTYPFYGKLGGQNNAFGAYPGQPMVYYKGQYQMQIPQKDTAWDPYGTTIAAIKDTPVSGVTMSNGYWDSVHKLIMGYGDNSSSADHVQTYDYGDFYKIFNEKSPVDNIVFDFKYRTKKHNLTDIITTNTTASDLNSKYGTDGNGFELLTNFHGKNVDLFGTPLSGAAADPTQTTPVYVVSTGGVIDNQSGVENIAGYYATEWVVYGNTSGTTYQRISGGGKNSIPPEVLVLNNNSTSFNDTTYPSADASHNVTDWQAMYTALKQYAGHPVMISYEAADAQQGQGMYYTGTGGATRNDGRWLYSKNGENITSTIRIDVSHDSGATYVENPASGETGHIDGLSAYFTNADAYQKMTYSTTIDPDKTYDFEAKTTNASYKFVGWYMEDGTKITSDNVSHTERSGSYTFVARFMEVSSGQLTLSHSVDTGEIVRVDGHDYTCNGSGTAKIGAVITDADTDEVLRTFDLSSSDITIPERFIGNDKNYNITVTLEATADTNTAYGTSKLANTDASSVTEARFFNPKTPTTSGKTTTYTFTFNVKDDLYNGTTQRALALTYHSYFIQYKFNYQINYTFNDRNGETQQYKRIGTLTPGEANTYVKKVDSNRYLDKSFIEKMAPYESNFGQDITWNFEDYLISTGGEDGSNYEYAINAHYTATQTNLNKRNITFVLPYQHNNGVAVMTTDGIGTKDTTTNLELIAVTDEDGKITQDNRVDFNTIPVLPNNGVNGIFDEDGKKNWVAAPATITDGGSILNFQYWSVKPTDRAGENDPDVARCYFQGFNFVAYDNYIITPVYGESTVEPSEIGRNTNITYVETTRNQWNSNGTDYAKTQTSSAADLLYNDFIVAYNFDGKDIYNGDANADIAELGVVVERIQKLEIKDDGTYDTTLSRYTGIAPDENGVNAAIASTTDIALSGKNKISKHAIAASELDNKNRIQFFNGIYNSAGWVQNDEGGVPAQNYGYKNYVYRAYSYMKLKNDTVIKSAVPAYFTMYDVATADAIDM